MLSLPPRNFKNLLKFKTKNDTYGHAIGDELLIIVPQRIKGALREMDTPARIGGNEFIAVITNLATNEDYKQTLQRLLLVMKFELDDFATRYSSLTYIRRLPASLIKEEQSSLHFA
jgi:diguanylate cyclase (GGDEF)-like protein